MSSRPRRSASTRAAAAAAAVEQKSSRQEPPVRSASNPVESASSVHKSAEEKQFEEALKLLRLDPDGESKERDYARAIKDNLFEAFDMSEQFTEEGRFKKSGYQPCYCKRCPAQYQLPMTNVNLGRRIWLFDLEMTNQTFPNLIHYISEIAAVRADGNDVFHRYVFYKKLHPGYQAVVDRVGLNQRSLQISAWDDEEASTTYAEAIAAMTVAIPCNALLISNGRDHDPLHLIANLRLRCALEVANSLEDLIQLKRWRWTSLERIRVDLMGSSSVGSMRRGPRNRIVQRVITSCSTPV